MLNKGNMFSAIRVFCWLFTSGGIYASLYDPHLFPEQGPFFEGWYMRVTDFDSRDSFGLLFGSVLPDTGRNILSDPLVVSSFLYRRCNGEENVCELTSVDGKVNLGDLRITVGGENVTSDPDQTSPANFIWQVNTKEHGGSFQQIGDKTEFNFRLGDAIIRGEASDPVPWNDAGTGPEGWLVNLPLPLHWFVYSLRSKLNFYEIQNLTSGVVMTGSIGAVHLEKNWGKSFPEKWIWSEGVSLTSDNASFAISGGLVDFTFLKVDAYLIGFRNPAKGLSIDFRPDNSITTTEIDGCKGTVNVTATSALFSLEITVSAPAKTYSSCLLGPGTKGFKSVCVESFDGIASIKVYKRSMIPFRYKLIDKQTFEHSALEFGGINVCQDKCKSK